MLAHKLRTPLNAVLASLELLLDMQDDLSQDEVRDFVSDAVGGARLLHAAVNDVLAYAEGSSAYRTSRRPLPLPSCRRLLMPSAGDVEPARHYAYTWQSSAVRRSATGQGRRRTDHIRVARKQPKIPSSPHAKKQYAITVAQVANTVHITVADNGVSLSPQQIKWALTPYLQGEKYFTGEMAGMGLGLPLVAALLWQVGGEIRSTIAPMRPA